MDNLLWKAVRVEVELNLDSTGYNATPEEIDIITTKVINKDSIWDEFNYGVMEIVEKVLGE